MAELRAARADDVGGIVDIDPLSLGRAEEIRALVGEGASLVAVDGGQIVGFLAVRPGHFYRHDFIDLLFVAPGSRRQGTGRALLRAALRGLTSRATCDNGNVNGLLLTICNRLRRRKVSLS